MWGFYVMVTLTNLKVTLNIRLNGDIYNLTNYLLVNKK